MTKEPKKSAYATGPNGEKIPGSERQSMDDLMEIREDLRQHPEGLMLGEVIVSMYDLIADPGTTFEDARDVRTADGHASFLLTTEDYRPARITLTFEEE